VSAQRAAELQTLLEGISLPAKKPALIAYAREHDESAAADLQALPDGEYTSLDEVGEALAPVQPPRSKADAQLPRDEGGGPPGREAYLDPQPEPGRVRADAPTGNPPQKAIEEQSKRRDRQQERQQQLG
jgi:hypothetical protein